jgi:WD40 repeat protein
MLIFRLGHRFCHVVVSAMIVLAALTFPADRAAAEKARGFLGVELANLNAADLSFLGWETVRGTKVLRVKPGSPAQTSGLEAGDILIEIDGTEVADTADFQRAITSREPGTEIVLTLLRRGTESQVSVVLDDLTLKADAGEELRSVPSREPLLRIETGRHTNRIWRMSLSADGRVLATGSADKTVRLWSMPDGSLIRILRVPVGPGSEGEVRAVALSPDGRFVAAGGWDAGYDKFGGDHIYIFDTVTGAVAHRLSGQTEFVSHMEFSRDGGFLAVAMHGRGGLRIWDTRTWRAVEHYEGTGSTSYGLNFDGSGRIVTTNWDGRIRLYDADFALAAEAEGRSGKLPYGVAFSPDDSQIAVAYADSRVVDVVSAETLEFLRSFEVISSDPGAFLAVAWSADGRYLYGAGSYRDERGTHPIIRWPSSGKGETIAYSGSTDTILGLASFGDAGIIYASTDPAFGLIDENSELVVYRGANKVDMRGNRSDTLAISADGWRAVLEIDFPLEDFWTFDLSTLSLKKTKTVPDGFHRADTESLKELDWLDVFDPTINGVKLGIDQHETGRALAILPDKQSFVLGGDWSLNRFDAQGQTIWRVSTSTVWGVNLSADGRTIVATHVDGTVRWYRTSDGVELLALYVDPTVHPKRWVLFTPKGYYTASPGGEDLIGWHVNREWHENADFFSVSRFRNRFRRPDVVQTVLETLDEDEAIRVANEKAERDRESLEVEKLLPPVIEILSPKTGTAVDAPGLVLEYKVRSPSGLPVTRLDVRLDGRPYEPQKARGAFNYSGGTAAIKVEVPERDVEITLIAHTEFSVSEAVSVEIKWVGEVAASATKPKLFALLVGISDYEKSHLKLNWAAQDASDVDAALLAQRGRRYSDVETLVLTDEKATLQGILEGLEWLEEKTTAEDTAVIFLAGHGITTKKLRFYFLPVGGDPDRPLSTAIGGEVLIRFVNDVLGKVVMFIDACHSARGLEGPVDTQGAVDLSAVTNELASVENGAVMYAASTGRQLAVENDEWENGAFTEALLEGYGGGADYTRDNKISTDELGLWLRTRVRELTNDQQEPVMLKSKAIREFEISSVQ